MFTERSRLVREASAPRSERVVTEVSAEARKGSGSA